MIVLGDVRLWSFLGFSILIYKRSCFSIFFIAIALANTQVFLKIHWILYNIDAHFICYLNLKVDSIFCSAMIHVFYVKTLKLTISTKAPILTVILRISSERKRQLLIKSLFKKKSKRTIIS